MSDPEREEVKSRQEFGIWKWRPPYLQRFKSIKFFLLVVIVAILVKDCTGIYFILLSEKLKQQYRLSSARYQTFTSGSNIGAILLLFLYPFIEWLPKKSLWIGVGLFIAGIGLGIVTLPGIFLYKDLDTAYGTMVLGYLCFGLGTSTVTFLAIDYIDNNVEERRVPTYVGYLLSAMLISQIFGGGLGYLALQFYDEPGDGPWWIGLFILAVLQLSISPLLAMFPSSLSPEASIEDSLKVNGGNQEPQVMKFCKAKEILSDYFFSTIRVFRSKLFIFTFASYILTSCAVWGLRNNVVTIVEHMYGREKGNLAMVIVLITMIGGVTAALTGRLTEKFRINLQQLTSWNICVLTVFAALVLGLYSYGCDNLVIPINEGYHDLSLPCNSGCESLSHYNNHSYLCSEDGTTIFLNPCHAGCSDNRTDNCNCALQYAGSPNVTVGRCNANCEGPYFYFCFTVILMPMLLFSGPLGPGKFATVLRSVDKSDEALALMLFQVGGALLAMLPAPPLFGFMLDKACLIGERIEDGIDCDLYDKDVMRRDPNLAIVVLLAMAIAFEALIWDGIAKKVNLFGSDNKVSAKEYFKKKAQETKEGLNESIKSVKDKISSVANSPKTTP